MYIDPSGWEATTRGIEMAELRGTLRDQRTGAQKEEGENPNWRVCRGGNRRNRLEHLVYSAVSILGKGCSTAVAAAGLQGCHLRGIGRTRGGLGAGRPGPLAVKRPWDTDAIQTPA